jgi:hypothetical protein
MHASEGPPILVEGDATLHETSDESVLCELVLAEGSCEKTTAIAKWLRFDKVRSAQE